MLYDFTNLAEHLTKLGYPEETESGFKIIKRDLSQEEKSGNLEFRDDGIYLKIDGQEYKGYMYIKHPFVKRYGFPKFHITNCIVIQEQRARGNFDNRYYWHNSNFVDLMDKDTGEEFVKQNIMLCSKCKAHSSIENYLDTEGYFNLLDKLEQKGIDVEVDIFGYTLDWERRSRKFRKEKQYTCECCGLKIEIPGNKRFIHAHHKNGNKLNNENNNLECLCVLCHSFKDANHTHNFERKRMRAEINSFIKIYRKELTEIGNPFLNKFS